MIKQREGYKQIFSELAKQRIDINCCPVCGLHQSKWKRKPRWTCCSSVCTAKFWNTDNGFVVVKSWQELRRRAIKRDKSRCRICGKILMKEFSIRGDTSPEHYPPDSEFVRREHQRYGVPTDTEWIVLRHIDSSQIVMDHIKPIALGGDEWDINNLQTLCIDCNKIKTAQDAKDIAKQRAIDKSQAVNRTLV